MKIFDFMPSPAAQPLFMLTSAKSLCNSFVIHKTLFTHYKIVKCTIREDFILNKRL